MPFTSDAYLLSILLLLAALSPCVPGAPIQDDASPTDSPDGEPSGEEAERPPGMLGLLRVWKSAIGVTRRHNLEFQNEFPGEMYEHLSEYNIQSLPEGCRHNLSKESCLQRLAFGLVKYMVLLRFVEMEYPTNSIVAEAKLYLGCLSGLIRGELKHPAQVPVLSSAQEQQMLKELGSPDTFHRKMTAHSILQQLQNFLIDGKREVTRREMNRAKGRAGYYFLHEHVRTEGAKC